MNTNADRLLIIDDEPEVCAFIGDVAEDFGFDVVATNTPKEFWSLYGPFAPTVIILDLVMPDADGVETQQALDFLRSVGCEMNQGYFISKPLSPAELPEVVHRWNQGTALGTFVA